VTVNASRVVGGLAGIVGARNLLLICDQKASYFCPLGFDGEMSRRPS
jgi:hypothetical protein